MDYGKRYGFSLIELMLVLVVIGALTAGILNVYKHQRFEADINAIKSDAEQLGQALNQYYYKHCRDDDFPKKDKIADYPVDMQALIFDRLLPPDSYVEIPWVKFSMAIRFNPDTDANNQKDYNLWVFAKIDKTEEQVDYIRGQLNAVFDERQEKKNTIGWMRLPAQRPATMESANWIMGASAADFNNFFKSPNTINPCPY